MFVFMRCIAGCYVILGSEIQPELVLSAAVAEPFKCLCLATRMRYKLTLLLDVVVIHGPTNPYLHRFHHSFDVASRNYLEAI